MSLAGSNRKPALTAAASKIGFSRVTADKLKDEPWQDRAWGVYADLPEIFYMTRYRKDVAAQIEYFVATVDEPGADPNLDDGRGAKVLQGEGGPELLRRIVSELVVHWDVPGEAHLVRFEEAPFWRVLSTQELKREGQSKTFLWGDETNQMGTIDRDNVYRVWDPHPRYHWQADSPVRHVLDNAEELILLTREAKARSLSRINAGTFWIPDGVDMSPFADDEEGTPDDFARELTNYMTRPLKDVGSASSLVPWIITANRDDIAAVRHITFERDWDINLELRRDLLRSVATGLDLPPEILTGMADLNHWSAWLVSEQAVSQHVLPTVDAILDSLTTNWFRPLLEASGLDPDLYVLWRDPSPATVPPDQSDVAIRLNELGVISDEATRRVTNFDDEDAPTPEELEAKAARKVATPEELPTDGPPDPIRAAVDPDFIAQVAEAVRRLQEGDPPLAEAAVTAAVRRRIVATELADIDAELLTWCQEKADAEIDRILGIVGKSLTAATDPLDESMLASLARQLDEKIAEAQAAARGWVGGLVGKGIDATSEAAARGQGIQVILNGILEAVRRKLFTPGATPDPIDLGRMPDVTTPTEAIRNGLSRAGGGPAVYENRKAVELIGNGQHLHNELEEGGFFADGFVWKYGHPSNQFEPHRNLNGTEFRTWDAPQLTVGFGHSWLRRSHYAPGDHKGCCCAFVQILAESSPISPDTDATGVQPVQTFPNSVTPRIDRHTLSLDDVNGTLSADQLRTAQEAFRTMDARWPGMLDELQEIRVSGDLPGDFLATKSRWQIIYNENHIGDVAKSRANWTDLHDDHLPGLVATKAGGAADDLIYMRNVSIHEMGHIGDHQFRAVASKSQVDRLHAFFTRAQTEDGLLSGLNPSYFAQENYAEFVAEALADAAINVNPNTISLQIAELFDEVFKP